MSVINKQNAEHYPWGKACEAWHFLKSPSLSIIQEKVPSAESETKHYHTQAQQFFYILEGIAHIELGEINHMISKGEGLHVPAGQAHKLSNKEVSDLVFLVISEPMSHKDRVEI